MPAVLAAERSGLSSPDGRTENYGFGGRIEYSKIGGIVTQNNCHARFL
jgi:hypothetical protein